MKNYVNELDGQKDFYERFNLDVDFMVSNDGIYNGVMFENKLRIDNVGKVFFQLIKYASKLRMLGKLLPEILIANDLCNELAYVINSNDFLEDIEKVYLGSSSKNNDGFIVDPKKFLKIDYSSFEGVKQLLDLISNAGYTKYHIDFNNILSLSKEFYKVNPNKDAFLMGDNCEIRNPKILADRVLPYTNKNNNEFSSIMDCLNSKVLQAELGAFYTPDFYVKLSQKMLMDRIEQLKSIGLDYIVIDRAAGSGQLFEGLSDEVLSHCVLSTIEPNEYLILQEKFLGKSVVVVPPTDALAYDIIPTEFDGDGNLISDFVREKVNDPNCAIIMYENPPFSESGGKNKKDISGSMSWKNSFVCNEMKKSVKGVVSNDLANLFIWSAFEYYLKKPFDSYILYSPIKYWKQQNLVNKDIINSFVCNRKHFHASEGAIVCVHWSNVDKVINSFESNVFEVVPDGRLYFVDSDKNTDDCDPVKINKVYSLLSENYDKRKFDDDTEDFLWCNLNGTVFDGDESRIRLDSRFNSNILGYMKTESFNMDPSSVCLLTKPIYNANGFFLRVDNFVEKLPMFCASVSYEFFEWFQKGLICKTFDGKGSYIKDKEFLKKCLFYTCLSFMNKCRSLNGPDGRLYKNELCFEEGTVAYKELQNFELDESEKSLLEKYNLILNFIKGCDEYNPDYTYGTYQIQDEINIDKVIQIVNKKGKMVGEKVKKYPELNSLLDSLKRELKLYFKHKIFDDLFKYELLK